MKLLRYFSYSVPHKYSFFFFLARKARVLKAFNPRMRGKQARVRGARYLMCINKCKNMSVIRQQFIQRRPHLVSKSGVSSSMWHLFFQVSSFTNAEHALLPSNSIKFYPWSPTRSRDDAVSTDFHGTHLRLSQFQAILLQQSCESVFQVQQCQPHASAVSWSYAKR